MRELIPPTRGTEYEVRFGAPADNILKRAAERQCDLIMLGAHHASNFACHLPGAVAHRIVCEAPCPVMTVHSHEWAPDRYRRPSLGTLRRKWRERQHRSSPLL